MKRKLFIAVIMLLTMNLGAQTQNKTEINTNYVNPNIDNYNKTYTYRLFPTENVWTFIKLNTRTGQLWQLQIEEKDKDQKETSLNDVSLVDKQQEVDNRFTLYATQNGTFILLDQIDGKTWQVKWSTNPKQRKIIPTA